jgi:hypothetical protein
MTPIPRVLRAVTRSTSRPTRPPPDERMAALVGLLEEQGFVPGDDDDEDDEDDFEFESEECREIDESFPEGDTDLPGQTADAESGSYERGDVLEGGLQTVEAGVGFVDEPEALDEFIELFGSDLFARCMDEAFRLGMEQDPAAADVGELDVEVEQIDSSAGDEGGGIRFTGNVGVSGFSIPVAFEIEFVREGRRAVYLMTARVGAGEPLDRAAYLELLLADA